MKMYETTSSSGSSELRRSGRRWWLAASLVAAAGLSIGCEEDMDDDDVTMDEPDSAYVEDDADLEMAEAERLPPPPSSAEYDDAEREIDPSELAAGEPRPEAVAAPDVRTRQMASQWAGGRVASASWDVETDESDKEITKTLMIPSHDGSPALEITRTQPATVRAGEPLQYRITLRNVQEHPLRGVSLQEWRRGQVTIDRMSADASGMGASGQQSRMYGSPSGQSAMRGQDGRQGQSAQRSQRQGAGPAAEGGHSQWEIGTLMPGESRTIAVQGVVTGEGKVATCLTADFEPTICVTTNVVKPQLRLTRALGSQQALVCEEVEVMYELENVGSGPTREATIVEELPQGLVTADGDRQVRMTVGALRPGETEQKMVRVSAERPGSFASHATVSTDALQVRSEQDEVVFVRPELQLSLDAPAEAFTGRAIPVNVSLSNTGDGPARDAFIEIADLQDMQQVSISTQQIEMNGDRLMLPTLNPGDSRDFTITFSPTAPGSRSISAVASAYCAETVNDTLGVQIRGVEAVRLEAIDLTDPVVVDDEVVYEISVKNQGSAESLNVQVKAQLPGEMTFVSGDGDSRVRGDGQRVSMTPLDRLAPGDVATWRVRANVDEPGKTRLRVTLTSDATKREVIEQEPTTLLPKPPTERGGNNSNR